MFGFCLQHDSTDGNVGQLVCAALRLIFTIKHVPLRMNGKNFGDFSSGLQFNVSRTSVYDQMIFPSASAVVCVKC